MSSHILPEGAFWPDGHAFLAKFPEKVPMVKWSALQVVMMLPPILPFCSFENQVNN